MEFQKYSWTDGMSKLPNQINHEEWDRPTNIWREEIQPFIDWWSDVYYEEAYKRKIPPRQHKKFFQKILGKQTTVVQFRYRCWMWHRQEEGWALYVDKRGPAFHVRSGVSPDEAWQAFLSFKAEVEGWINLHPL